MGIQGARIHVALTPPPPATACFSDLQVEKAVMAALEKAGVQVYQDCLLAQLNQGEPQLQQLTSASFTTSSQPLHLQCGVSQRFDSSLLPSQAVVHPAYRKLHGHFIPGMSLDQSVGATQVYFSSWMKVRSEDSSSSIMLRSGCQGNCQGSNTSTRPGWRCSSLSRKSFCGSFNTCFHASTQPPA